MPGAIRVQGAFVTDGDVEAVANESKAMFGPAEFDSELMEVLEDKEENMGESNTFSETDFRRKMIIEASKLAFSKNGLRVSDLQRSLSLGYNRAFMEVADITGIILTKLDGSSKGGIIVSICRELKIPVRLVGVGEKIDDLEPFIAEDFVGALFDD